MKQKKLMVMCAVCAVIAGSVIAAVSCDNGGWEWALDHAASAAIGGIRQEADARTADGRSFIKTGSDAVLTLTLDNERGIALEIKTGGITLDGTPPASPPSVRFFTSGGAELSPGDNGYYYLPRPARDVRVKIIGPAEGEYRLTLDLKAGDWSRPFGSRTAVVTCSAHPLQAAVDASATGTAGAPAAITVLSDIEMASGGNVTVPSGKDIRLVSGGGRRIVKRVTGNTVNPIFTVNSGGQLTLENIIIDGGAVWAGTTPPWGGSPSPGRARLQPILSGIARHSASRNVDQERFAFLSGTVAAASATGNVLGAA
jgi:hypothetical protein